MILLVILLFQRFGCTSFVWGCVRFGLFGKRVRNKVVRDLKIRVIGLAIVAKGLLSHNDNHSFPLVATLLALEPAMLSDERKTQNARAETSSSNPYSCLCALCSRVCRRWGIYTARRGVKRKNRL